MRNALKYLQLQATLEALGVRIVTAQHSFGEGPSARLLEHLMASLAEMESAENARRTRNGMRSAALRGSCPASVAPLGYKFQAEGSSATAAHGGVALKRHLVPDELEAPTIRELFATYSKLGAVATAATLNGRHLILRGAEWTRERVLRVLSDTVYVGEFVWGRKSDQPVVVNTAPIVSRAIFDLAQRERSRRDPKRGAGRRAASPLLLGSGIVRCGACGGAFQLQTSGKRKANGDRHEYLQCARARRAGVDACLGRPIPVAQLDALIVEHVAEALLADHRVRAMLTALVAQDGPLAAQSAQERKRCQREVADLERAQAGLLRAVETQALPLDLIAARLREVRSRLEPARRSLANAEALRRRTSGPTEPAELERFCEAVKVRLIADRSLAGALIRAHIERLVVERDGRISIVPRVQHRDKNPSRS
jgi:DNA invertase Pin-like site-specific DNA recombinase